MIDASALIAFLLREEGWRDLVKYMVRTISVDHIVKELYNAVWKASIKQRKLSAENVTKIMQLFKSYVGKNLILEDEKDYIDDAYKIALEYTITVYDALYIALAKKKGLPLLTLDKRQIEVGEKIGINLIKP